MLAELRGEERTVGLVMLANRAGFNRRFSNDDLSLFDTLAANASAALQYDRLEQAVSDLRVLQERLHHQAYHDPLTGLANRALFREPVEAPLAAGSGQTAVLFIDLDDFKAVNDTLGHAVGDELLRAVAHRLGGACGRRPRRPAGRGRVRDPLPRRPGDRARRRRRRRRVLRPFERRSRSAPASSPSRLSVGVATSHHSGDAHRGAAARRRRGDVRGQGRRQVPLRGLRRPRCATRVVRRHDLRQDLRQAIDDGAARLALPADRRPPDGRGARHGGARALAAPDPRLLAPADFIPVAEETGLIVPLGRLVLERGVPAGARLGRRGRSRVDVQVNLSARELEDDGLLDTVAAVLADTGIAPSRLVLEITETLLMRDAERGGATLTGCATSACASPSTTSARATRR